MSTPINGPVVETTTMESNLNSVQSVLSVDLNAASSSSATSIPMESSPISPQSIPSIDLGAVPSSTAAAMPPIKFTLFPKLPLELRRKVWREAITPRIVYLFKDSSSTRYAWKAATSSIISLLCVNKESRSEGLKMYEQPFSTRYLPGQERECCGPCYVNFANDLIYFDFINLTLCFNMIFVHEMQPGDRFINIALNNTSLVGLKDELGYIIHDEDQDPHEMFVWTWETCKLQYIKELVLVVDHLQHRKNPKKFVLSEKTNRQTPIKKAIEVDFTAFKSHFPKAVLPELSTCYRLLGPD